MSTGPDIDTLVANCLAAHAQDVCSWPGDHAHVLAAEVRRLRLGAAAVRALHRPHPAYPDHCERCGSTPYPCATICTLDGEATP